MNLLEPQQHKASKVWRGLSALLDFHYFFIEGDGQRTLKVVKYVYLNSDLLLWTHLDFLFQAVHVAYL